MAPALATKRLRKELIQLQNEPPPGIIAEPKESNILTWYYAVRGPTDTPYDGGIYVGKLVFPPDYPMMGPSIMMATPSGRFQTNTKICMSMSGDFHPESWNPMWSVATILQGIQSFMASDELTTGGMKASDVDRKKFANYSHEYNRKNFFHLFEGDIEAAMKRADEQSEKAAAEKGQKAAAEEEENGGRAARRARRAAARKALQEENKDDDAEEEEDDDDGGSDGEEEDLAVKTEALSLEEMEKRRKKNAKKRVKQKAKKAVIAAEQGTE